MAQRGLGSLRTRAAVGCANADHCCVRCHPCCHHRFRGSTGRGAFERVSRSRSARQSLRRRFPRSIACSRTMPRPTTCRAPLGHRHRRPAWRTPGATGIRDVATKAPVDADTVFRIASMTKSFTAMAILKLRDEGKLSLDDPAETLRAGAEGARSIRPPIRRGSRSGTAVARRRVSRGQPVGRPAARRHRRASCRRCCARGIPFSNAPGIAYEYSNYGFAILGRIVDASVSGMPYARLRRRRTS